jgi:hypothetical protein
MLFFQIISRTGFDDQSSRNNFPTREDCLLRRVFKMLFRQFSYAEFPCKSKSGAWKDVWVSSLCTFIIVTRLFRPKQRVGFMKVIDHRLP